MTSVYSGMIGLVLGALVGPSAAQVSGASVDAGGGAVAPSSQLQLTPQQRTAIGNAVRAASAKVRVPDNVPATVGAQVPPVTELYFLPDNALASAPEAKGVKYTMARNQVVLVDPTTMRVVEVIP
jgi:hypothetical protein